jgi:hypothetical protein
MPFNCPVAPADPDPSLVLQTTTVLAGAELVRFYSKSKKFPAGSFNPNTGKRIDVEEDGARFNPFPGAPAPNIPTMYAADTLPAAALESVFHNVDHSPSPSFPKMQLADWHYSNDELYEVTPNGLQIVVAIGLNVPDVVAVDGSGNLDVANSFSSQVIKFDRADSPSLSFDHTKVGSTSADSPKALGIQNIGNAALNISALTFPADFPAGTLEDVGECTSIVSLEAADSCALIIKFKPVTPLGTKSSAALSETVKVTTNDLNEAKSLQQVNVTGTELPAN